MCVHHLPCFLLSYKNQINYVPLQDSIKALTLLTRSSPFTGRDVSHRSGVAHPLRKWNTRTFSRLNLLVSARYDMHDHTDSTKLSTHSILRVPICPLSYPIYIAPLSYYTSPSVWLVHTPRFGISLNKVKRRELLFTSLRRTGKHSRREMYFN